MLSVLSPVVTNYQEVSSTSLTEHSVNSPGILRAPMVTDSSHLEQLLRKEVKSQHPVMHVYTFYIFFCSCKEQLRGKH